MKNKSLSFLGKSTIFTGMTFLQKGIAFFLVPLYTHFLSPEQYGIANLANSVAAIYILIASFALDDAIARYYFEFRNDSKKLKKVVATITLSSFSISIVFFIILILGKRILVSPFTNNIDFYPYVFLALAPVLFSSVYGLMQKILIIEGKAWHYSINTLIFFVINTGLCLLLIIAFELGALGLLLASAITYSIYFIYSLLFLISKMSISFDKQIYKESMKYGLILLPNRVASWGMGGINKVIVGNVMSISALGIFNIATTFSSLMVVFANSLSLSLQPWVFSKLEQGDTGKKDLFKITNIIAASFCITGLGISLFASEIFYLLIDIRYLDAVHLMPTLLFGTIASAYSVLFVHILFYYTKYTKYIAYSTILGALINIIICLLLIPTYGAIGACIAIALSELTACIIKILYSIKAIEQKHSWFTMFYFLGISFIISQICIYLNTILIIRIILFIVFVVSYLLVIKKELLYLISTVFRKN